ncbi:MAG TPA: sigma-54 dependent transcriptional regulator [Longimicrobium sp.]|nr:sigma-54 dependent transcriptional regulator [Longimicrobium sp.]
MPHPSLLVVDPAPDTLAAAREAAGGRADVRHAASLGEGLELMRGRSWDAVLLSLDLPAVDMALVARVVESGVPAASLVLAASRPTMQAMVESSRLGVLGLVASPVDARELAGLLREVSAADEVVPLAAGGDDEGDEDAAIGASPAMLEVFRMVGRVAGSPATVLILGQSGTGKELVAKAIHRNSPRAPGPFVAINCAAIPENLLESELFGHEKGAFTGAITRKIGRFERAHGGTLFLDEIGDMSLSLQSKILRALQEREIERVGGEGRIPVDVRVVAATNRDLRAAIGEGTFREDLYFRLAVVTLNLPRLADRGSDLDLLIRHFVARYAAQYGRQVRGVARPVFELLNRHPWPGNVRELKNVLERAVLMAHGPVLLPDHLPLDQLRPATPDAGAEDGSPLPGYAPEMSMADVERLHIREVLKRVKGHLGRASEVLGVHRNTLTRKIREYGLEEAVRG